MVKVWMIRCISSQLHTSFIAQTPAQVLVLFYSEYGHIAEMAKAVAEGAQAVSGAQVTVRISCSSSARASSLAQVRRVPETLSKEVLAKMHATEIQAQLDREIPVMHNPNEVRGEEQARR